MMTAEINYGLIAIIGVITSVMIQIIPQVIQTLKELPWVNTKTKIITITWIVNVLVGIMVTFLFVVFTPDATVLQKIGIGFMTGIANAFGVKLKYEKSGLPSLRETENKPSKPEQPKEVELDLTEVK
jgi:hypothetical protein